MCIIVVVLDAHFPFLASFAANSRGNQESCSQVLLKIILRPGQTDRGKIHQNIDFKKISQCQIPIQKDRYFDVGKPVLGPWMELQQHTTLLLI